MHAFVTVGRAGENLWPAKVFSADNEMSARIYIDVTAGVANACRENLRAFRGSEIWAKMNIAERAACEKTITAPIDSIDPSALDTIELDAVITYTYQRVDLNG